MDCIETRQCNMEDLDSAMGRMYLNNNTQLMMVDGDVKEESMETADNDMNCEATRLSTFRNWPHYAPVMPAALARAGFFFTNSKDIVECFSCKGRIQDWEHGDTAMGEHKKLFPACPFVQGQDSRNKPLLAKRQDAMPQPSPRQRILLSPNQMESGTECAQQQLANVLEQELKIKDKKQEVEAAANAQLEEANRTLQREEKRLLTFVNWPRNSAVQPEDLAKAGFYYVGYGDTVQCFACFGTLKNWKETDVPMTEHRSHFPSCHFVLGINCGNRPIRLDRDEEMNLKLPVRVSDGVGPEDVRASEAVNHQQQQQQQQQHHKQQQQTASICNVNAVKPCVHPEYKELKRRLSTYHNWPETANVTPDELAQAGFYYTGIGDNCKCFYCDGGLRNWEPTDEPWMEHARWFPKCPYVLKRRGQEYVEFVNSACGEYTPSSEDLTSCEQMQHGDICELPPGSDVKVPGAMGYEDKGKLDKHEATLEAVMRSDPVIAILDMGYNRNTVQKALDERLQGNTVFPTAHEVLLAVWDYEKQVQEERDRSDNYSGINIAEYQRPESGGTASIQPVENFTNDSQHDDLQMGCPTSYQCEDIPSESERTLEELKEEKKCKICMDRDKCILFQPCGHLSVCDVCSQKLKKCPICRKGIRSAIRAYLS